MERLGRNDPCRCGSGQKYKRCCLRADEEREAASRPAPAPPPPDDDHHACDSCGELHEVDLHEDEPSRHVSPYGRAQEAAEFMNLRRLKRRDREAWELRIPTNVAALPTESIQRHLGDLGIDGSREAFLPLTEGRTSAWEIAEGWVTRAGLPRDAEVFCGLAAHQLWTRFCPERPSIETVEDDMQEGYELELEGDPVGACEAWGRVWAVLRTWLGPAHRTCSAADPLVRSREVLFNWTQDFGMACVPAAVEDPSWAAKGVDYHEQVLEQFQDESELYRINLLADLADLLERAGQKERAERVARDLVQAHPENGAGYVRLAELLDGRGDRAGALAVLKEARERMTDEPDDWSLDERVTDLEGPLDAEGGDSEDEPTCDRPGCYDPPRPGSRFCGGECEYVAGDA